MLADALDGSLSPEDQAIFDTHMAICGPCSDMLADARRGAAWLEMLRDPRPEPPAALLERILAQTTGTVLSHAAVAAPATESVFLAHPATPLPFRQRFALTFRNSGFFHSLLQPRLAMTAAMAFFSIALTMNLTGVHLSDLRPGDLRPSNIKQGFYSANARVVRYYEGLRVVYELESRVHEIESDSDTGTAPDTQKAAPAPANPSPQPPADQPDGTPPEPTKSRTKAPGPGSSQRENLMPNARFVAVNDRFFSRRQTIDPRTTSPIASAEIDFIEARKVRALA